MFHLSESYEGHSGDIKGIAEIEGSIVSCARDNSVRFWQLNKSYFHEGYVNALSASGLVISGSADKTMIVSDRGEQVAILVGHTDNVCALDARDDLILSGSWDSTIKLWKDFECILTIQGHAFAVWDVKFVQKYLLSASADKTIKLWDMNGKLLVTFTGHTDVVRSLGILPEVGFVSCSNDATLRIWALSGECLKVIHGHSSFIYTLSILSTGEIISAGEDRTVKVWNTQGECLQTIAIPCNSIWVVQSLKNGDFAIGGSDAVLRVFSRDKNRIASSLVLKNFEEAVAISSIPASQIGADKISSPDVLTQPGEKEGQVKLFKGVDGVEAYQWSMSNQEWTNVGKVVDAIGSDRKQLYNGKEYDYVFDIDIADGADPLKLPYNVTGFPALFFKILENPYQAAQEFIHKYELPQDYLDQIANFILKNTKGISLRPADQSSLSDPFTGGTRYMPPLDSSIKTQHSIISETTFAVFKSGNLDAIKDKIGTFNQSFVNTRNGLDISEINLLDSVIENLKQRKCPFTEKQINVIKKLATEWPVENRFPALDLLSDIAGINVKVAISIMSIDNLISDIELNRSTSKSEQIVLMFKLRCLANMISHGDAQPDIIAKIDKIFEILKILTQGPVNNKNLALAIATTYMNMAVLLKISRKKSYPGLFSDCIKLTSLCEDLECQKRVLLAGGVILSSNPMDPIYKNDFITLLQETRKNNTNSSIIEVIDELLSLTTQS